VESSSPAQTLVCLMLSSLAKEVESSLCECLILPRRQPSLVRACFILFHKSEGLHSFVSCCSVRNIANLVLDTELAARASIEYAVADLGAYKIIIMGHDGCGGIQEVSFRSTRRVLIRVDYLTLLFSPLLHFQGHSLAQAEIARHAGYTVAERSSLFFLSLTSPSFLCAGRQLLNLNPLAFPVFSPAHYPTAVASWLQTIRDMMLPILLTMKSESPLVKRTINSDPREVFDMNSHIFKRDQSLNSTEGLGELIIKKPGYFDASLKLGVEENGEFELVFGVVVDASTYFSSSPFLFAHHVSRWLTDAIVYIHTHSVKRQVNNIADGSFIQSQCSFFLFSFRQRVVFSIPFSFPLQPSRGSRKERHSSRMGLLVSSSLSLFPHLLRSVSLHLVDAQHVRLSLRRNLPLPSFRHQLPRIRLSSGLIRDLGVSRCLGGSCFNMGRTDGYGSLQ